MKFFEHYKRSIAKTITYRILIVVSNSLIIYYFTGDVDLAKGFALMSTLVSTVVYFMHERIWNQIHWGKQKNKD